MDKPGQMNELGLKINQIEAPASLGEMAYEALKESLLNMDFSELPNNGRLDERVLATSLGVSRTPLREAIHRLVSEGFLKVVPRKGVYIVKLSKQEVIEILLVRAVLEGMAVRLATEYVTEKDIEKMKKLFSSFKPSTVKNQSLKYSEANIKFHELVLQTCQHGKLIELANNLNNQIRWIRFRTAAYDERHRNTLKEHLNIIKAIENKNPDLAEKQMRQHIEGLAKYLDEKVESLDW
ncbi:MAG: GntR family transcriptional regulator [Deltaproteobacteria bacterium]|nr:GntR family transcriptional regulator [Deltaproteobacteria bacterium]MBW2086721.1 GntR family transcriptional regulator [Deltaproteobacteria bacterium]